MDTSKPAEAEPRAMSADLSTGDEPGDDFLADTYPDTGQEPAPRPLWRRLVSIFPGVNV